ncbi:bestrophin-like domain [Paraburkholderia fungorum]|uniref:bestrophin-like domain n=1 Tax=Paraburkholderia fungorum TaxID=134537 RepID=UPI0038B78DB5
MSEVGSAVLVFVLLLVATGAGVWVRPLVPEEHKAHETVQLIQLVIGMLVTFAALVLGLMTASAKTSFDTASIDMRTYAADLIELDSTLREYGSATDEPRRLLRSYTAAAIASTWPDQPAPAGDYPKDIRSPDSSQTLESLQLGDLLTAAGKELRQLQTHDPLQQRLLDDALMQYRRVVDARWKLIEEAHSSISQPFLVTLNFWLCVIFLSFGLIAPRNALALVTITLGAISIASAIYVIVDLDTPFTGPIVVSSAPLRDTLGHLRR